MQEDRPAYCEQPEVQSNTGLEVCLTLRLGIDPGAKEAIFLSKILIALRSPVNIIAAKAKLADVKLDVK
jgi:hypothetical protein